MLYLTRARWAILAMAIVLPSAAAEALEKPIFCKEVLLVLQENCQVCHRPEGANFGDTVAPMENFFGRVDLNEDGFIDLDEAETAQKLLERQQGN